MIRALIFAIAIGLMACRLSPQDQKSEIHSLPQLPQEQIDQVIQYNFNKPDVILYLPFELVEISGLDHHDDQLVAINDEKGRVYLLDKSNGNINRYIPFGDSKDYEGVAVINDHYVVVESDGDLYDVAEKTERYKTPLSSKNDIEGLEYDPDNGRLLIATKRQSIEGEGKAVYAYDWKKKSFRDQPLLTIYPDSLWAFAKYEYHHLSKSKRKQIEKRIEDFAPSGIALNSKKELHVLSARGSSLAIYSTDMLLQSIILLDEKLLPQPEGITFDEADNLYISTEGKSLKAKICLYKKTSYD